MLLLKIISTVQIVFLLLYCEIHIVLCQNMKIRTGESPLAALWWRSEIFAISYLNRFLVNINCYFRSYYLFLQIVQSVLEVGIGSLLPYISTLRHEHIELKNFVCKCCNIRFYIVCIIQLKYFKSLNELDIGISIHLIIQD